MCAEWHCVFLLSTRNLIISPRARGRRNGSRIPRHPVRITPACAGKTLECLPGECRSQDHPRMRGEDMAKKRKSRKRKGSPPHARGRRRIGSTWLAQIGITPACAGKTRRRHIVDGYCPDHPRMRGEDCFSAQSKPRTAGSPPHARGRLERRGLERSSQGITPACAGKT